MSARGWRSVVLLTVLATAAVGIAGGLDFITRVIRPEQHTERVIQCQDSPACRGFIRKQLADALRALERVRGGVVGGRGKNPSGQPGPPEGGPATDGGKDGGSGPQGTTGAACDAFGQVGGLLGQPNPAGPEGPLAPVGLC
jgi:hypothetical protein